MKADIKKKVTIDVTMDSSEAVMFTQGGKHTVEISPSLLKDLGNVTLEITVQLERNEQGRFNNVCGRIQR